MKKQDIKPKETQTHEFMQGVSDVMIHTPTTSYSSEIIKQVRKEIKDICQKFQLSIQQYDVGDYLIDICNYSIQLNVFILKQMPKRYKKLLIVHSSNTIGTLIAFMVGSELKYILYIQKIGELNLMTSIMQIQIQLQSSPYLEDVMNLSILDTFKQIIQQQTTQGTQQSYFKNKQNKVLKSKLNYYEQHLLKLTTDIPLKTIEAIIQRFSVNKPICTGWTALFRYIYPNVFKSIIHKEKPTIFLYCFDIENASCKEYQIEGLQVVVIPVTGKCQITLMQDQDQINSGNINFFDNITYNPFISAHDPVASITYLYDQQMTPNNKILLATALVMAYIQQQKMIKQNKAKQLTLYANQTNIIPNIQNIGELIRMISISAIKSINLLTT